ncbi:hypothetical protein LV79_006601 [Actinokineospora globicatena]|nr:hypothetical protein [Actinokineospora globicatena]GLW82310.1 hypothetical protein Aglo01_67910 [Actinokineospora globicatena]GLW89097.1 hypothetical protein Aglo02_67360 [Actinokineospora globicatena]
MVWQILGFGDPWVEHEIVVDTMPRADIARTVGFDGHTYHLGGGVELTDSMKAVFTERLGIEFNPALTYVAENVSDYHGQLVHGLADFADELLPFLRESGGRLTFGIGNAGLEDGELVLLLTSHSRYPPPPAEPVLTIDRERAELTLVLGVD